MTYSERGRGAGSVKLTSGTNQDDLPEPGIEHQVAKMGHFYEWTEADWWWIFLAKRCQKDLPSTSTVAGSNGRTTKRPLKLEGDIWCGPISTFTKESALYYAQTHVWRKQHHGR